MVTLNRDTTDLVFLRIVVVYNNTVSSILGKRGERKDRQNKKDAYPLNLQLLKLQPLNIINVQI